MWFCWWQPWGQRGYMVTAQNSNSTFHSRFFQGGNKKVDYNGLNWVWNLTKNTIPTSKKQFLQQQKQENKKHQNNKSDASRDKLFQ